MEEGDCSRSVLDAGDPVFIRWNEVDAKDRLPMSDEDIVEPTFSGAFNGKIARIELRVEPSDYSTVCFLSIDGCPRIDRAKEAAKY